MKENWKRIVSLILVVFLLSTTQYSADSNETFVIDDLPVGKQSLNYIDPEFQSSVNQMVFQSYTKEKHRVWIANLNPETGLFISNDGYDLEVDSGIASIGPNAQTNNGPEWGLDKEGVALFYSKPDRNGIVQYWMAENIQEGNIKTTKLTDVPSPSGEGAIQGVVRQDSTRPTTQFFYRFSAGPEKNGESRWADENFATQINPIPNFNAGAFAPSWIPGTEDFVYGRFLSKSHSEIARYYTETKTFKDLTNEPNVYKQNIIAFYAPEYNNELLLLCIADKKEMAIYRDTGDGYTRFLTISPDDRKHPYLYSPELFQVNGRTYFAVLAVDLPDYHTATDGAIYVVGLGTESNDRLIRRIDNGQLANRYEPEIYMGRNEVFVFFNVGRNLRRARTGIKIKENQTTPANVEWFKFSKDYHPGTEDPNGKYLSGTELMRLTSHKGKLYASTSTFLDTFFVERYPAYPGPQILRKDSSEGPWFADHSFGVEYLRADCLESIQFSYDSTGKLLDKPESILIAGIWDIALNRQRMISVAIRNDGENRWIISNIDKNPDKDQGSVRSMIVHRDQVTGIQYLFIGAGVGKIYKGVFDPSSETKTRWVGSNELDFDAGRVQSMTICNNTLYAAFGYGDSQSPGDKGGLFRRIDGVNPTWEFVYGWEYNPNGKFEYLLRGISTVVDPENPNNQVIVGALEKPPKPVIIMINPSKNYVAKEEVNYEEYFTKIFGSKPNPKQYMSGAILNKLEPFTNPETGEKEHLVTTFIMHPKSPAKGFNGAYYMIRHKDMTYDWGSIYDTENLSDGEELQGVRTIEKSPFPDEPNVYYFGGYGADYENVKNTAWIYKGKLVVTKEDDPKPKPHPVFIELWVGKSTALVNGKSQPIEVPPMIKNGRTVVPLRFIAESILATVNYDSTNGKIVIILGTTTITLQINNPETTVEEMIEGSKTSRKITLESPPFTYQGRTLVPVRFISEVFGLEVQWESREQKITITK